MPKALRDSFEQSFDWVAPPGDISRRVHGAEVSYPNPPAIGRSLVSIPSIRYCRITR